MGAGSANNFSRDPVPSTTAIKGTISTTRATNKETMIALPMFLVAPFVSSA